jgi:Uma2 family endonuclease
MIARTATARQHTLADYETLPEGAPFQLIGGRLVMSPAPKLFHQNATLRMVRRIVEFLDDNDIGVVFIAPIDVYLSSANAYQPDLVFIAEGNLDIIGEANIQGVPDLVVEVLSSNASYDLGEKRDVYESCGVREYWIVDPERKSIDVLENVQGKLGNEFRVYSRARQGTGSVESKVLTGFTLDAAYVFAPIRRA